jgi:hypothetical protein
MQNKERVAVVSESAYYIKQVYIRYPLRDNVGFHHSLRFEVRTKLVSPLNRLCSPHRVGHLPLGRDWLSSKGNLRLFLRWHTHGVRKHATVTTIRLLLHLASCLIWISMPRASVGQIEVASGGHLALAWAAIG